MSQSASQCKQAYAREQQIKMEEHRKRLETLLLDAEDFELIAKPPNYYLSSGWPNIGAAWSSASPPTKPT
jgi:hypothetical protein